MSGQMSENSKRIAFWDMAKGLVMLLVIVGHVDGVPLLIRGLIFSFHMPFFFMANGFFIKNYDIKRTFRRSVRTLLLPYGVVCAISMVIFVIQNINSGYTVWEIAWRKIQAALLGMSNSSAIFTTVDSVWLVWFVICLFAARNIYVIIMHFIGRWHVAVQGGVMAALSAAGAIIGVKLAYLPWSLDVAFASLIFIWCGNMLSKYQLFERTFWKVVIPAVIVWAVPLALMIKIELATRSYPYGPVPFLEAIAGSLVVAGFFCFLEKKNVDLRFLSWVGKNSIVFLAVHCLEMMYIDWDGCIYPLLPFNVPWFLSIIIRCIFIILVSFLFVKVKGTIKACRRKVN